MSRRGKTMWPTLAVVSIFLVAGYGYYMYHEVSYRLRVSETRVEKFEKRHTSMKSQLQVVYEHRAKLEATLKKERQDHVAAKQELLSKLKEYEANLTRTRHEAFNRFNALDTQHKMLKVQHDDLLADHSRMEQQYVRLGEDHRVVVANLKEDYQKLKDAKERESKALQDRVQELYNENELLRSDIAQHVSTLNEEKKSSETCLEDMKRVQSEKRELFDEVKTLGEQVTKLKASLRSRQVSRGKKYAATSGPPPTKVSRTKTVKQLVTLPQVRKESDGNAAPGAGFIKRHKQRKVDRQGSDLRMRQLLIRNSALKQEDSIKDQYEKLPTEGGPVNEDIDDPKAKLNKRERDLQHLVKKGRVINGNLVQSDQAEQPNSRELTGDENQNLVKDGKGRSNVEGVAVAENKTKVSASESETLKFKGGDENSEVNGDKEEIKAEEEAGKDFMKKQLHLQLQNRKRSQDVVLIKRQDPKRDEEESLKETSMQPTTKRAEQLNRGIKNTGGNASYGVENEMNRAIIGDRRQLQPPKTNSARKQKDIAISDKDPDVDSKVRDAHQRAPMSDQETPVKNSPVASPLKDKKRVVAFTEEADHSDVALRSTEKPVLETVGSTPKVSLSETQPRMTPVAKDGPLLQDQKALRKPDPTPSPPISAKSYGLRENKDTREQAPEPLIKGELSNLGAKESKNVVNGLLEKDSEAAESKEPGSNTGKGSKHNLEKVSVSNQQEVPTKQIVPRMKDMHAERPTEELKIPETLEDDENSDQWGDDQPVEGKNRRVIEGERETKLSRVAEEKEEDVESRNGVQARGKEAKQDTDESDPLQSEGNGADEEERDSDQFDSEENN